MVWGRVEDWGRRALEEVEERIPQPEAQSWVPSWARNPWEAAGRYIGRLDEPITGRPGQAIQAVEQRVPVLGPVFGATARNLYSGARGAFAAADLATQATEQALGYGYQKLLPWTEPRYRISDLARPEALYRPLPTQEPAHRIPGGPTVQAVKKTPDEHLWQASRIYYSWMTEPDRHTRVLDRIGAGEDIEIVLKEEETGAEILRALNDPLWFAPAIGEMRGQAGVIREAIEAVPARTRLQLGIDLPFEAKSIAPWNMVKRFFGPTRQSRKYNVQEAVSSVMTFKLQTPRSADEAIEVVRRAIAGQWPKRAGQMTVGEQKLHAILQGTGAELLDDATDIQRIASEGLKRAEDLPTIKKFLADPEGYGTLEKLGPGIIKDIDQVADEFARHTLRVPDPNLAEQGMAKMKNALSRVWLLPNPAYALRNIYNNVERGLVWGVNMFMESIDDVLRFADKVLERDEAAKVARRVPEIAEDVMRRTGIQRAIAGPAEIRPTGKGARRLLEVGGIVANWGEEKQGVQIWRSMFSRIKEANWRPKSVGGHIASIPDDIADVIEARYGARMLDSLRTEIQTSLTGADLLDRVERLFGGFPTLGRLFDADELQRVAPEVIGAANDALKTGDWASLDEMVEGFVRHGGELGKATTRMKDAGPKVAADMLPMDQEQMRAVTETSDWWTRGGKELVEQWRGIIADETEKAKLATRNLLGDVNFRKARYELDDIDGGHAKLWEDFFSWKDNLWKRVFAQRDSGRLSKQQLDVIFTEARRAMGSRFLETRQNQADDLRSFIQKWAGDMPIPPGRAEQAARGVTQAGDLALLPERMRRAKAVGWDLTMQSTPSGGYYYTLSRPRPGRPPQELHEPTWRAVESRLEGWEGGALPGRQPTSGVIGRQFDDVHQMATETVEGFRSKQMQELLDFVEKLKGRAGEAVPPRNLTDWVSWGRGIDDEVKAVVGAQYDSLPDVLKSALGPEKLKRIAITSGIEGEGGRYLPREGVLYFESLEEAKKSETILHELVHAAEGDWLDNRQVMEWLQSRRIPVSPEQLQSASKSGLGYYMFAREDLANDITRYLREPENIHPPLREFFDNLLRPPRPTGVGADADILRRVGQFAKDEWVPALEDMNLAAHRIGTRVRDLALVNYRARRGYDFWLQFAFPYHFWYTRTGVNTLRRMIDKPAVAVMYKAIYDAIEEANGEDGYPGRFINRVSVPLHGAPDYLGEQLIFDPLRTTSPVPTFIDPYLPEVESDTPLGKKIRELSSVMSLAPWITYPLILSGKLGNVGDWLTGSQVPAFRQLKGLTAAAGLGPPGGVQISPMRKLAGLPMQEQHDPYRADRMVSNMSAPIEEALSGMKETGEITVQEAMDAMNTRRGSVWQEAVRRSGIERGVGLVGSLFGISGVSLYPPGEKMQRQAKMARDDGLDAAHPGWNDLSYGEQLQLRVQSPEVDKAIGDAWEEFYEDYPYYRTRTFLFKDPRQRLIDTINQDFYNRNYATQAEVKKVLGDKFSTFFVRKATRDYSKFAQEELIEIANRLGRPTGEPVEVKTAQERMELPLFPGGVGAEIEPVETLEDIPEVPAHISAVYEQYQDERRARFSEDIIFIQEQYFKRDRGSDEARRWLASHPELQEYWDWSREFKAQNRRFAEWYGELTDAEERAAERFEERFEGLPGLVADPYRDFLDYREKTYPDIKPVQDGYFELPEKSQARRDYLKENPELKEYWDWSRAFKSRNPEFAQWYEKEISAPAAGRQPKEVALAIPSPGAGVPYTQAGDQDRVMTGAWDREPWSRYGSLGRVPYSPRGGGGAQVPAPAPTGAFEQMQAGLPQEIVGRIMGWLAQTPANRAIYASRFPELAQWILGQAPEFLAALDNAYQEYVGQQQTQRTRRSPMVRWYTRKWD